MESAERVNSEPSKARDDDECCECMGYARDPKIELIMKILFWVSALALPVIGFLMFHFHYFVQDVFCTNGESLNTAEQLWCVPPEKTTVTAYSSEGIKVFRMNKNKLPNMTLHYSSVGKQVIVQPEGEEYYPFVLNPGSYATALLKTDPAIPCYLLDNVNMKRFMDKDSFNPIFSGKGELNVESFSTNKSNSFFFVFDYHDGKGSSSKEATFTMNFNYSGYDVSGLNPVCSGDNTCKLEDVGTDEIVVASNNDTDVHNASLKLPDAIDIAPLCICCISFALCLVYMGFYMTDQLIGLRRRRRAFAAFRAAYFKLYGDGGERANGNDN